MCSWFDGWIWLWKFAFVMFFGLCVYFCFAETSFITPWTSRPNFRSLVSKKNENIVWKRKEEMGRKKRRGDSILVLQAFGFYKKSKTVSHSLADSLLILTQKYEKWTTNTHNSCSVVCHLQWEGEKEEKSWPSTSILGQIQWIQSLSLSPFKFSRKRMNAVDEEEGLKVTSSVSLSSTLC